MDDKISTFPESEAVVRLEKRLKRKQAEQLLEDKSRELYEKYQSLSTNAKLMEAVIVNANDGVMITTADLDNGGPEIIYVNDAFVRMSGYSREEVLGQTPRILQGPGTDRAVLNELREKLSQGRSFKGQLQNYTKDGVAYWLDISIAPVVDEDGNVTHFTAIERDVTQRMAIEKEMQIHREAAEVANRAKGDFLANMSHELRTPMNGIIGLSELLIDMDLSSEQKELTEAINGSSRNLLILLNDILDLSKIEANELTLEDIPFNIHRVVHQTVGLLENTAARKNLSLDAKVSALMPERLLGDPARIQQILNNLINNAIKFTEQGHVHIDVTSRPDHAGDPVLHIRVEDTGIGIPEGKQQAVFQKFTQADVSTARKYGGTGLGLAITKDLVELMGGVISLESVEGRGTTFYVEIPLEEASSDSLVIADEDIRGRDNVCLDTNVPVLVVDDHPVNLLFMRKLLTKMGFTHVDEAGSGSQAIELYEKVRHPMVFMDCQMPEMDGFEASACIRDIEAYTNESKIIAVTADAMKGARERCIDSGMNDYISKPVDTNKLQAVLNEWLPAVRGDARVVPVVDDGSVAVTEVQDGGVDCDTCDLIDWDRIVLFTDGDTEEERVLIDLFLTCSRETMDAFCDVVDEDDAMRWVEVAHKMKGSASNLGAVVLAEICAQAEARGLGMAHDERREVHQRVEKAYDDVCLVLRDRMREISVSS